MDTPAPPNQRLDSWKAIADYLSRDVGTVRRWEKTLGLPVHRVSGLRGRSVFAYTFEIDDWLKASREQPAATSPSPEPASLEPASLGVSDFRSEPPRAAIRWHWMIVAAALLLAVAAVGVVAFRQGRVEDLRVAVTRTGVVAADRDGHEVWRHDFGAEYKTAISEIGRTSLVVPGPAPNVYVATSHRSNTSDENVEGGMLTAFDRRGRVMRTFAFDDEYRFRRTIFRAPWVITTFAVENGDPNRRVAVAAHHYLWDPSIVTILDNEWRRRGTFAHAGWVEGLHWLAQDRLLIGGFSESHDGGMLAILDPAAMDGQGPEPAGTKFYCENCGAAQALRMAVMPRSELNIVTASRFNRAVIEVLPDRIIARTIEIPALAPGERVADAVYEFTRSLDLLAASYSANYWEMHRSLEVAGKLRHSKEACPDRFGPRTMLEWDRASGWHTRNIQPVQ